MKQITLIFSLLTISICSDTFIISCPTCIGMPKKGARPYFERHGIRYILPQQTKPATETKPTSNSPEANSAPQPDRDQH